MLKREKHELSFSVVDVSNGYVCFIIDKQSHRYGNFLPKDVRFNLSSFKVKSMAFPKINGNSFYVKGYEKEKDNTLLYCPLDQWEIIKKIPEEYTKLWDLYYKKTALKESIAHWVRMNEFAYRMSLKEEKPSGTSISVCILTALGESIGAEHCSLCHNFVCEECPLYLFKKEGCKTPNSTYSKVCRADTWSKFMTQSLYMINDLESALKAINPDYTNIKMSYETKEPKNYPKEFKHIKGANAFMDIFASYTMDEIKSMLETLTTSQLITLASKIHGIMYKRLKAER